MIIKNFINENLSIYFGCEIDFDHGNKRVNRLMSNLDLTDKIVRTNHLTTLMITHNMKDALTYGERLIMFYQGQIILDVRGEEKAKLTVSDLLKKFDEAEQTLEN